MVYDPSELFASTAPYYARFRPGYPRDLFDHLVARFSLDGSQSVLDLGCGTGQIALPLAPHVRQVLAVDPEPTMLHEGRNAAVERGIHNIDWREGSSDQLRVLADNQSFDFVTMGASFHWMDRDGVLVELANHVIGKGAVVLVSDGPPERKVDTAWGSAIAQIRAKYLGPARRAGSGTYTEPVDSHLDVLRRSAFSDVETAGWEWTLDRTIDQIVGLQFSYSFSSPMLLGDRTDAFADEIRAALEGFAVEGVITTQHYTEAMIGIKRSK